MEKYGETFYTRHLTPAAVKENKNLSDRLWKQSKAQCRK